MIQIAILILALGALPTFTTYHPIRNVGDLGPVVTDIESHLHAGHPYRDNDKITHTHEGTHGINSDLRNRFGKPCFYVLENRFVQIQREPRTTIGEVAKLVPVLLRGTVYRSYLVESRRYWEHQPSFLWDEFVAYANGSECRRQNTIHARSETVKYMLEFVIYSTCVPWAAKSDDPQIRAFLMWQIERSLRIAKASGVQSVYLVHLRVASNAAKLRQFMRDYYGAKWTLKTLGF